MSRLHLAGGLLVPLDPAQEEAFRADILIEDGRIAAVGPGLEAGDAERIDASDCLVLPGFVDTHRHTWQSALRHRLGDLSFSGYGAHMLGRLAPHYTPDDVYVGTLLGALSALDAGTTCLLDWSHVQNSPAHADAAVAALRDSGLRAVFAHGYPRDPAVNWTNGSELRHPADIVRVRRELLPDDDAMVTLAMAARGPEMTTMDVACADLDLARELGVRVSVHIGAADFGPRHHAVRRLAESGRLGEDLCMVHVSSTPADELALIADHGVHVSLGPWTEQVVGGAGGCPVTALTAAGIRPALSGDTETSGSGDMFTQMRALLLAARSTEGGPQAPVEAAYGQLDALHCATTAGAAALGMTHRIGSLSPGKQADIVLIRTTDVNLAPVHDPVGAVVLAAHPGNVDTVIVAGRIRKRAGRLLTADLGHLVERAAASAERLLASADVPAIVARREPR